MMPWSVARCSRHRIDAASVPCRRSARPRRAPPRPCDSMNILPSSHSWRARPYSRSGRTPVTNHSPSQPGPFDVRGHIRSTRAIACRQVVPAEIVGQCRHFGCRGAEEPGDHHRLRRTSVPADRGLKRLARLLREAVQVEAIVPVGVADQRQPVRTEPVERVLKGNAPGDPVEVARCRVCSRRQPARRESRSRRSP